MTLRVSFACGIACSLADDDPGCLDEHELAKPKKWSSWTVRGRSYMIVQADRWQLVVAALMVVGVGMVVKGLDGIAVKGNR
jgi:hypothetical protein